MSRLIGVEGSVLVHLGPVVMKVDPIFNIDRNHFKTGPARGHDMLIH
jgi:hypothetical protein